VFRIIVEAAKEDGIPYQVDVEAGGTGTDGNAMQLNRGAWRLGLWVFPSVHAHALRGLGPGGRGELREVDGGRIVGGFVRIRTSLRGCRETLRPAAAVTLASPPTIRSLVQLSRRSAVAIASPDSDFADSLTEPPMGRKLAFAGAVTTLWTIDRSDSAALRTGVRFASEVKVLETQLVVGFSEGPHRGGKCAVRPAHTPIWIYINPRRSSLNA